MPYTFLCVSDKQFPKMEQNALLNKLDEYDDFLSELNRLWIKEKKCTLKNFDAFTNE